MYLMQNWFNLSDEGIEDAIYDSYAMRNFLGINLIDDQVPDAATFLKFRHLLEKNHIGRKIFEDVKERLDKTALMMHGGSIVDATIISAPSSTKNKERKREPEMHQTKKGRQYYHGMKVHVSADAGSGYVHAITGTVANIHDITETEKLLREDDIVCCGDSGYSGAEKRDEIRNSRHLSSIEFRRNVKFSQLRISDKYQGFNWDKEIEKRKSSVRSKIEHLFLIVKGQFGYARVVYRGIAKNMNRFHILFASANLVKCISAGRTKDFCMV